MTVPDAVAALAARQAGVVARRQLNALGFDRSRVRNEIRGGRWTPIGPSVLATFSGTSTRLQRMWAAVLHAGPGAVVGELTAAELGGLRGWQRDTITVLTPYTVTPLEGVRFRRTDRDLGLLTRAARGRSVGEPQPPSCQIEPAILLFASRERSTRTGDGAVAAVVQQHLATPAGLRRWLRQLRPLPRSGRLASLLTDIEGGSESVAELDVLRMCRDSGLPRPARQVQRRDASGRLRWTDCEWRVASGTLVLEVDGSFHMQADHWEDDLARQRRLSGAGRIVVRCTARELRDEPDLVARDLMALGLRSGAERAP